MNTDKPWLDEPNYEAFEYKDYVCVLRRNPLGAWNGYVLLTPNDPWYDIKNYNDIPIEVHGGLTYGKYTTDGLDNKVYAIGFDCAHWDDIVPMMVDENKKALIEKYPELLEIYDRIDKIFDEKDMQNPITYKDINFVRKEIEYMVEQIIKAKNCINNSVGCPK